MAIVESDHKSSDNKSARGADGSVAGQSDQSPAADESVQASGPAFPRLRTLVYMLFVAGAAVAVIFTNLGGPRMEGDEENYALCVDQIRRSGEWLVLRPQPPVPYFEKPPLYMWLTAATYDALPGLETKYRFWSAAFGVACVALTCLFGAMLFSPEIGLLGAALLLTNRRFLLEHGARQGVMDSGLTFLLVVILLLYWWVLRGRAAWVAWAGIGVAAGLACLCKPFIGALMLLPVALHAFTLGRSAPHRPRKSGLLVAFIAAAAIAMPWYLYLIGSARDGVKPAQAFGTTFLKRLTVGLDDRHVQGPLYYLSEISASSGAFALFIPAVLFAMFVAWQRPASSPNARRARMAFALLATLAVGWIAMLSISRSKLLHYAYPGFPAIAILIAALFAALVQRVTSRIRNPSVATRLSAGAWLAAAGALVVGCCWLTFSIMPRQVKKYLPAEMYQTFRPAIDAGTMRLVFAGVPALPAEPHDNEAFDTTDLFYLSHMTGVTRAGSLEELARLLKDEQPTLLLMSKSLDMEELNRRLDLRSRGDERFAVDHRAFVLSALDMAPLLRPRLSDGTASRYVQWVAPKAMSQSIDGAAGELSFDGTFAFGVTPPMPDPCRLVVTVRPAPQVVGRTVRWSVQIQGEAELPRPSMPMHATQPFSVHLARDSRRPMGSREVRFRMTLADAQQPTLPLAGTIVDTELIVLPRVPVENENKAR